MEGNAPFFDSLLKGQQEFIRNWMNMAKGFQEAFAPFMKPAEGMDAQKNVFTLYNSWMKTMGGSFDGMMKNFPADAGKDAASKLFRGFESYMKLYDFWSPLFKAMQEKSFDLKSLQSALDPSQYKEVLDKIFGFVSPETATEFYGQSSRLVETWGASAQNFVKPWADAFQKNVGVFADISSAADPNASMNVLHNMFSAYDNTFGKAFNVPPVGKDREKIELVTKTMDAYSEYLNRNTVFQHKMYVTGENAMRKVIETIAQKVKEGAEIKNYDEFYKIWTDVNEKAYTALFNTPEFSKIQGELLEAALDFRKLYHHMIELYLVDFPVPVRSEMNDVYKTIYDLKRKVRALEKKVNEKPVKEVKE